VLLSLRNRLKFGVESGEWIVKKINEFCEEFVYFRGRGDTQLLLKIFKVRVHSVDPDIEEILKLGLKIEGIIIAQDMLLAAFC